MQNRNSNRIKALWIFFLAFALCMPVLAADGTAKMSPALQALLDSGATGSEDVIVTFKARPGKSDNDAITRNGGELKRSYKALPMRAARMPVQALNGLSRNPNVEYITLDGPIAALGLPGRLTANLPNDASINYSVVSSGIGVAVLDSGVGNPVDIWPSPTQFDFVGQADSPAYGLFDTYGHGTHIAGIIAGDGYDSNGAYRGIAPYSDILSLRVLNSNGQGVVSDVIAALDWLLINGSSYDIKVVNMSLGKPIEDSAANDPLVQAVESVWDAGFTVDAEPQRFTQRYAENHFSQTFCLAYCYRATDQVGSNSQCPCC